MRQSLFQLEFKLIQLSDLDKFFELKNIRITNLFYKKRLMILSLSHSRLAVY